MWAGAEGGRETGLSPAGGARAAGRPGPGPGGRRHSPSHPSLSALSPHLRALTRTCKEFIVGCGMCAWRKEAAWPMWGGGERKVCESAQVASSGRLLDIPWGGGVPRTSFGGSPPDRSGRATLAPDVWPWSRGSHRGGRETGTPLAGVVMGGPCGLGDVRARPTGHACTAERRRESERAGHAPGQRGLSQAIGACMCVCCVCVCVLLETDVRACGLKACGAGGRCADGKRKESAGRGRRGAAGEARVLTLVSPFLSLPPSPSLPPHACPSCGRAAAGAPVAQPPRTRSRLRVVREWMGVCVRERGVAPLFPPAAAPPPPQSLSHSALALLTHPSSTRPTPSPRQPNRRSMSRVSVWRVCAGVCGCVRATKGAGTERETPDPLLPWQRPHQPASLAASSSHARTHAQHTQTPPLPPPLPLPPLPAGPP